MKGVFVIKFKNKIILALLSISIMYPGFTFANYNENPLKSPNMINSISNERAWDRESISNEIRVEIRELKMKVKKGEITKEQFHEEVKKLIPEYPGTNCNKPRFKERPEIPEDARIKIKELKIKLNNGSITEEEFHEKLKQLIPEKIKYLEHRKDFLNKNSE